MVLWSGPVSSWTVIRGDVPVVPVHRANRSGSALPGIQTLVPDTPCDVVLPWRGDWCPFRPRHKDGLQGSGGYVRPSASVQLWCCVHPRGLEPRLKARHLQCPVAARLRPWLGMLPFMPPSLVHRGPARAGHERRLASVTYPSAGLPGARTPVSGASPESSGEWSLEL